MKFLCPSCKAKYQIADEKVAGRSVRMKCRKCGFMIQVSSAMAAPSGAGSEPPIADDDATSAPPPAAEPAKKSAPQAAAPPPAAPRVVPSAAAKAPAAKGPALPAPRPPPGKQVGAVPKPAAPPARPSAFKASAPLAAAPRPVAAAAATAVAAAPQAHDYEGEDDVTRMADAGALAGAFTQAFGGGADVAAEVPAALSMPGDEWFVGINGVPVGPIRLSELRSKAASGAVNKESLVWRDGFEDWRPLKTYPELLAIVEEGLSSARASLTPFTPPASEARDVTAKRGVAAADPFAAAASPSAVTGSAVVTDDLAAFVPPRRGTSPMVWLAMVIAIALGLTLGFVLFGGQKPGETKIVEKIVEKEVPAKDQVGPAAANNGIPETVVADPQAPKKTGGPGKAAPGASAAEGKPLTGLQGLNGLSGLGPSGGPAASGPAGNSNNGAQLDGGQIQTTVSRYTGSVKRRCWQPALDARAKDAPMTAKVTVSITVGGTGSVQNASTSGDPRGYSGLANCIASSVKSWQFPASGGTTIANVPFVFAGQ